MAIAHVNTTAVGDQSTTVTISSFVVSGTNPALVLKVAHRGTASVTGATWNTSENFDIEIADNSSTARCTLLTLNNPTATTADVVVTFSGGSRCVVAVSLYTGVDQTDVFRSGTIQSANGNSTTPAVSVTGTIGDIIVDSLAQVSAGPDTATAAHTQRSNLARTGGGDDVRGASQELAATGAADSMSWTMSATDDWAVCAGALLPSVGGGVSIPVIMNQLRNQGIA